MRHVLALTGSKAGDGLADPKLVLTWLLGAMGAPAFLIGLLVPVREAGSLLPQLAIAGLIRRQSRRKWIWALGSAGQGVAVLGMAAVALLTESRTAGWLIVALLAMFALGRGACSVSFKDVLGKTVPRASRGSATGAAGSISALLVLLFGYAISVGWIPRSIDAMAAVLVVAGLLWLFAAVVFLSIDEAPGETEGGVGAAAVLRSQFRLLRGDRKLQHFIVVRALLLATALAPPYMLLFMDGRAGGNGMGAGLGPFVIASSLAAVSSAYLWGRMSDSSSRKVLIAAAILAAISIVMALGVGRFLPARGGAEWIHAAIYFLLMVAHQGVRLGRSTHIVDMAGQARRADYTALSNTAIGVLLLAGSAFGVLAHVSGIGAVLWCFVLMSVLAAVAACGLDEVQRA